MSTPTKGEIAASGRGGTRPTFKRVGWIAAGYIAAAAVAAVLIQTRYWFIDPAVVTASSGMFAGGDLIGFVLIAGTLGLAPTFFLFRLATEIHPRALAVTLLALSTTALPSLWLLSALPSRPIHFTPPWDELAGLAITFLIFPRVVAIPVALIVLAIAFLLARDRPTRVLLACALVLEAVPLALLVIHFARTAVLP